MDATVEMDAGCNVYQLVLVDRHKDQKAMASCLLRLLSEYDSLLG